MSSELIKYLNLESGSTVLDCTVGCGGHAERLLKEIGASGRLFGIDRDEQAVLRARNRLQTFRNCVLMQGNFRYLEQVFSQLKIKTVDAMIFDLGLSSLQLETANRGFSIRADGPLDMRMDKSLHLSAFDLVNFLPRESLANILRQYGQERWHNRIARAIVRERKKSPIIRTRQLADLIRRVAPAGRSKIHPATRTFQALRIAVNNELEALRIALNKSVDYLTVGGRICVISFHSLEDRIVKIQFRKFAKMAKLKIITKKPIRPSRTEIHANPSSRSARLRAAERIG